MFMGMNRELQTYNGLDLGVPHVHGDEPANQIRIMGLY